MLAYRKIVTLAMIILSLIAGCGRAEPTALPTATPVPPTKTAVPPIATATLVPPTATATPKPEITPRASIPPQAGSLSIISPLETTELAGGHDLRVALYLVDQDDQPVEGATVQAELWAPSGEVFATLPCAGKDQGRYLADYVSLPLRGAGGAWRVVARATWGDGKQVQAERTFRADPSLSEMYQSRHGFWIEPPGVFGLGIGFYNLQGGGGLHFEDWLYEDGSGYVILDNYRYNAGGVTFATLEVHWRGADFPADEAATIAHAQSLAEAGLHHRDPDTPITNLAAEPATFQGRPAWRVTGRWKEAYTAKGAAECPAEWMVFGCPGSDWLWTLLISTDNVTHMNDLQAVQKTFECPASVGDAAALTVTPLRLQ